MIAFDRLENLKMGLYQAFKSHFSGTEADMAKKWDACWVFISMMYPDYAFRSAAGYYYKKITGLPEEENSWAKKGKYFFDRMSLTTEMYANGAISSTLGE